MKERHRWCVLLAVSSALVAPLTVGTQGIAPARAFCADGTCCPEPHSDCIINNNLTENAYAKLDGGSCQTNPGPKT